MIYRPLLDKNRQKLLNYNQNLISLLYVTWTNSMKLYFNFSNHNNDRKSNILKRLKTVTCNDKKYEYRIVTVQWRGREILLGGG